MNRRLLTTIVAALVLLAVPSSAAAHVTLQPSSAPAGEFVRLDLRVPNEQDNSATTKVDVRFPKGFVFASYEPVPGWKVSVQHSKLDKPVTAEGEKFTEQISQMTWTGDGKQGKIGPGQFQDFGLSVQIPDKTGTTLVFPATQTYDNGDVVRWIGAQDSEEPAAHVEVTATTGEEHGSAAEGATGESGTTAEETAGGEETSSGDGGSDDSKTLSIIALIVGGLGLLTGGFAINAARRRP